MPSEPPVHAGILVKPIPTRFWWLRRITVTAGLIILAVAAARWWWSAKAGHIYETEVARIKAAGEPLFPEDFLLPPVPQDRNAAPLLVKATQALVLNQGQTRLLKSLGRYKADVPRHLRELNQLMTASTAARSWVRQAGALPNVDWGSPGPSLNRASPSADFHQLSDCIVTAAYVAHLQGDDLETIRSLEDALSLAAHVAHYRTLSAAWLQLGTIDSVTTAIENLSPTLRFSRPQSETASSTRHASRQHGQQLINRLLDERPVREAFLWGVYAERALHFDTERRLSSGKDRTVSFQLAAPPVGQLERAYLSMVRPMLVIETCRRLRQFDRGLITGAKATYFSQVTPGSETAPRPGQGPTAYGFGGGSVLFSRDLHRTCFYQLARARLAAAALAIRMYELDHDERPASLQALVPDYLPCLPTSPLLESDSVLYYQKEGSVPRVYFAGPDPHAKTTLYLNGPSAGRESASQGAKSSS
ncbi:MAG TPA: hypothetical protein PKY77_02545 [Phycisphaerae bacterium]|nr:hypothetical protein [Phycisphaerae bacterium]HRY66623.1 hypothetical protein [Phycisphaerae bacterium]HSA29080.1 hypothetical protein [Phycisphaerae bacterium]